jgi:cytidine deaminase
VKTVAVPEALASLVGAATRAMQQAYAPYSGFRVGAALRGTGGVEAVGCNVENAAYPAGLCAERAAVASAVVQGVRTFDTLVVVTEADVPTPPCGICRQVLVEFSPDLEIVSVTTSGRRAQWRLRDLLPSPFTPASLAHS